MVGHLLSQSWCDNGACLPVHFIMFFLLFAVINRIEKAQFQNVIRGGVYCSMEESGELAKLGTWTSFFQILSVILSMFCCLDCFIATKGMRPLPNSAAESP